MTCPLCGGRVTSAAERYDGWCVRCYVRLVLRVPSWMTERYRAKWLEVRNG